MRQNKYFILLMIIISFSISAKSPSIDSSLVIGVEKVNLRVRPSFLSKKKGELKYGRRVKILVQKKKWVKVSTSKKKQGWIHRSSLGQKKSILKDIGQGKEVARKKYQDEVALAGKGFSEQHEEHYKKKNPKVSFKGVNYIEKIKVSDKALKKFAKRGNLNINF